MRNNKLQEAREQGKQDALDRIEQQVEYDDFIPEPYKERVLESIKRVRGNLI